MSLTSVCTSSRNPNSKLEGYSDRYGKAVKPPYGPRIDDPVTRTFLIPGNSALEGDSHLQLLPYLVYSSDSSPRALLRCGSWSSFTIPSHMSHSASIV